MRDWGGGQQASLCSGGEGGEWDLRRGRGWGEVALMMKIILMMMIVPQFVVIMTLMLTTLAAAVMMVLLLFGWVISNPMPDDKSHMMQSVVSNTDKMVWCILY